MAVVVTLEASDLLGACLELRDLYGDGRHVPDHLKRRLVTMAETGDGVSELDGCTMRAGAELLAIVANLRAIRI